MSTENKLPWDALWWSDDTHEYECGAYPENRDKWTHMAVPRAEAQRLYQLDQDCGRGVFAQAFTQMCHRLEGQAVAFGNIDNIAALSAELEELRTRLKMAEEAAKILFEYFKHVRQDILYPPDAKDLQQALNLLKQFMESGK